MAKIKILTAAEMGEADRRTEIDFGTPLTALMENAGAAVARFVERQYPEAKRVLVLCGKGNNGGDGLLAARGLAGSGREVTVALLGVEVELKGLPAAVMAALKVDAPDVKILSVIDEAQAAGLPFEETDIVVDAIVGTGFKPPLRGVAAALRERVADLQGPVVAVDLPSGWDADSVEQSAALPEQVAFRADAVVTFTAPKRAHVFGHLTPGKTFGPVVVAEIGSPEAAVASAENLHWTGTAKTIAEQPRNINSNKGLYGHVLVVGGSYGTAGAPAMASLAALRTGAGLVTAAVPEGVLSLVALVASELMVTPLSQGEKGAVDLRNLEPERLAELTKRITVIALGPGLSTKGDAPEFARRLVAGTDVPIVIDADALNAFEGRGELLNGEERVMVLTPHPGEMARLAGMTVKEVEADRIGLARRFATEQKLTLVLKGWRTLVAHPDGSIGVNTTGNPSMAKGGSGDILTGIVAAMLAQFPRDVARAVEAAVYLHGLAGDFAALAMDEHTVLATDTVAHLTDAFRCRTRDADGLEWITGMQSRFWRG